jgi:hypothetical protein
VHLQQALSEITVLFLRVLCIARHKLLKLGTIALDSSKVHANASRHSALSYGHARKIEEPECRWFSGRDRGRTAV